MSQLLQQLAELAGPAVHRRSIEVGGRKLEVCFRELSGDEAEALFDIRDDDGKPDRAKSRGLRHRLIAASLCEEDGKRAVTVDQVAKMSNRLVRALNDAALEVNGLSKTETEDDDAKNP